MSKCIATVANLVNADARLTYNFTSYSSKIIQFKLRLSVSKSVLILKDEYCSPQVHSLLL